MALGDRIAVMRDGKIQQIGTGTELYERPLTQFVAFFIGTPSINLFDAELRANAGQIDVVTSSFTIRLPTELRAKALAFVGKPVRLGIRPEDLHTPKTAPFPVSNENIIQGEVQVIEPTATGSTTYLNTTTPDAQDFIATFKVRLPTSYIGKVIPLAVNQRKMHLFDVETERSIIYG